MLEEHKELLLLGNEIFFNELGKTDGMAHGSKLCEYKNQAGDEANQCLYRAL